MSFLINFLPYYIFVNIALIVFFFSKNLPDIKKIFCKISKRDYNILLLILVLSLFILLFISPWHHLLYFDEWETMESARHMLLSGTYSICNNGNVGNCQSIVMPPHPISFSATISIFYFLIGIDNIQAKITTAFFGLTSIALIFFLSYILFKRTKAALWTSFLFSLMPIHLLYSTSVSSDVFALSLSLMSILSFFVYINLMTKKSLFLSFSLLAFSIQIRQELLILFFLFFVLLFLNMNKVKIKQFILPFFAFLVFIIPHILFFNETSRWKHYISKTLVFSLENVSRNTYYIKFWFDDIQHLAYTMLALIAIFLLIKHRNKLFFLLIWFFSFFTIYILYWFTNENRFLIPLFPSLVLLSGFALDRISSYIRGKIFTGLIISIILIFFASSIPTILASSYPHETHYGEEVFLEFLKQKLKDDSSLIVTPTPYIINFELDKDAIKSDKMSTISGLLSRGDKIYFYENIFCIIPPSAMMCEMLHKNYKFKKLYSMEVFDHHSNLRVFISEN